MIHHCYKFILLILSLIIITSCSSTKRFADKNNSVNNKKFSGFEIGEASYYASEFDGKKTASGEIYDMDDLTAAHLDYPFNTIVRVINLSNNKSVEVRINDRMPYFKGRIIDLSYGAAKKIGMINSGIQKVKIVVLKWGRE